MRTKVLLVLALAVVVAPAAFADITLTFSSPVTMVSFYSSESTSLPLSVTAYGNSVTTVTAASGTGSGTVTMFGVSGVAGVTVVDFSGTVNHYVLDDLTYEVGNTQYVINFDDPSFGPFNTVGSFYSFMAGGPSFGANGWIDHYPLYNYPDYPYHSSPNVLFEGYPLPPPTPPPSVPEPGTLLLFGSGLISAAGAIRRKLMA